MHSDDGDLRGLFPQAPPGKFNCLRRLRPNLQPWPLMDTDLATRSPARPTGDASYLVSVRQVAVLLHTSFRSRLAIKDGAARSRRFLWRQSAALDGDGLSNSAIQAFNSV